MPFFLDHIFTTVTSAPPHLNGITEILPCEPLRPYVRCFWAGDGRAGVRVIPDICGDIIIPLEEKSQSVFCAANGKSFLTQSSAPQFGIRFYAWAVPLFLHTDASQLFNRQVPAEDVFVRFSSVEARIREAPHLRARIKIAQDYLLPLLAAQEFDSAVMNALCCAAVRTGRTSAASMAQYSSVSLRTLERKFAFSVGMSPRKALSLIRYQLLWQECFHSRFSMSDCIERFGFYDQSHLCNSFKSYHGISLSQARAELFALFHSSGATL